MALEFSIAHFFHIVFIAWGVGGATIAAILMRKAEKEPGLMPAAMKFTEAISKLIWIAIIGLIITGIATTAMSAGKGYFDQTILAVKHLVFAAIIIAGLTITFKLLPKLKKHSPKAGEKPTVEFLKAKKHLQITSSISLIMWYIVVALSVIM